MFNKDTFHPDMKVTFVYLHDTRDGQQHVVREEQSGWVLQAVISRASFQRLPRNGKSFFTMMSSHINNQFAKKRGIGKKLLLTVRTVMLEEHTVPPGAAHAAVTDDSPALLKKLSLVRTYWCQPGPTPLWDQVEYRVNGPMCVWIYQAAGIPK